MALMSGTPCSSSQSRHVGIQRVSHNLILAPPPTALPAACRPVHCFGIRSQGQQLTAARAGLLPKGSFPAQPPHLPPRVNQTTSLCCLSQPSFPRSVCLARWAATVQDTCYASLPQLASDGSFFIFMSGFPTRDLHPIYITPMLGTHKPCVATGDSARR
jgi:hypothetical protein